MPKLIDTPLVHAPVVCSMGAAAAIGLGPRFPRPRLRPQDVYSGSIYTGNGAARSFVNGLNMSANGGLVIARKRADATGNRVTFVDSVRGGAQAIFSTANTAQAAGNDISTFDVNGFSVGASSSNMNPSTALMNAWAFRRAQEFFDVLPYTGNGAARSILHSLGAAPGMIIVKSLGTGDWHVWHRGASGVYQKLNTNEAAATSPSTTFGSVAPTAQDFSLPAGSVLNTNGQAYVAYLFGHDSSASGIIQAGNFATDASGNATVNLGWAPQFLLLKRTDAGGAGYDWFVMDTLRGWVNNSSLVISSLNNTAAEDNTSYFWNRPTATGFTLNGGWASANFVFLAIRAST